MLGVSVVLDTSVVYSAHLRDALLAPSSGIKGPRVAAGNGHFSVLNTESQVRALRGGRFPDIASRLARLVRRD